MTKQYVHLVAPVENFRLPEPKSYYGNRQVDQVVRYTQTHDWSPTHTAPRRVVCKNVELTQLKVFNS